MGPIGCRSYPADREPNPVLASCIDYEYLAVEIQQHFGAGIGTSLSHHHKVITY